MSNIFTILVLSAILIVLLILNNTTFYIVKTDVMQGSCIQTPYGCCADGVNSKINILGTNCPGYVPPPQLTS